MAVQAGRPMSEASTLVLVAVTHRRASLAVLESVKLDPTQSACLAQTLVGLFGTAEAVVVSTCNRTELYLYGRAPDAGAALESLITQSQGRHERLDACVVTLADDEAVGHLLRVAAGLESRVMGEVEILGQLRSAIAVARAAGSAGTHLSSVFRFATNTGRKAQRTTQSALTPSLPKLALDAARPISHAPAGLTVVLGAGKMARSTVVELAARGLDHRVCARRLDRAARLVGNVGQLVAFEDLSSALYEADVVVCATAARSPLLRVDDLERVMRTRSDRALTIVDLSLPRNVEPAVRLLPGVRLFDLDALVADATEIQIQRRQQIIAEEFGRYREWLSGRTIGHLIARLHECVRTTCRATLEESLIGTSMSTDALDSTARSMAKKLLHGPTMEIKQLVDSGHYDAALAVLASYGVSIENPGTTVATNLSMQEAS